MPESREDALFQFPRIAVTRFQHIATVVRLDHDRGATAQLFRNERRDVPEVHDGRNLHAVMSRGEAEVVDSVVWNRKRMKVDLADAEVLAGFDLFDAIA